MKGWCSPGVRRMAQMESSCVCWWEGRCSQRHFAALDILARLHRWHRSHYSHHMKRFHPLTPGLHGCNEVHQCWRQPREPRSRILGKHLEQLSSVFSHDLAIQNRVASSLVMTSWYCAGLNKNIPCRWFTYYSYISLCLVYICSFAL